MKRSARMDQAKETVEVVERGSCQSPDGKQVTVKEAVAGLVGGAGDFKVFDSASA